jgi:hypothetical protein
LGFPGPWWSKGWASYGSSMALFFTMSAGFSVYLDWPPRFANNWTHRGGSTPAAAQSPCRFCPKPCPAVYLLSKVENPAPIAAAADGAIAFSAGGSHGRRPVHASVRPLTGRRGSRVAMLPILEPHKENP